MFKIKSEINTPHTPKSETPNTHRKSNDTEGLDYWQMRARNLADSKLPRDWWEGKILDKYTANAAKFAPGYNWWTY